MQRLYVAFGLLLIVSPVWNKSDDRIVSGVPTAANELPWVAAIFSYSEDVREPPLFCSGSLISNRWILTSKDCVTEVDAHRFAVYLGAHNLSAFEPNRMLVSANKSILNDVADLALIRLSSPVTYNDYIRPIQLPPNEFQEAVSDPVIVSGWGAHTSDPSRPSQVLRKSAATVTSDSPCVNEFGSFSTIDICTNGALCRGDEGSPLTSKLSNGSFMLIGVASHVSSNCKSTSGFTAIQPHLKWIQSTTNSGPAAHFNILNLLFTLPLLMLVL